jgi:hypothetical protein
VPASSIPRSGTPSARASVSIDAATSSSVEGPSEITVAPTGQADPSSPELTAQTAHRSWVTMTSGLRRSISSASTAYSERPSATASRTWRSSEVAPSNVEVHLRDLAARHSNLPGFTRRSLPQGAFVIAAVRATAYLVTVMSILRDCAHIPP